MNSSTPRRRRHTPLLRRMASTGAWVTGALMTLTPTGLLGGQTAYAQAPRPPTHAVGAVPHSTPVLPPQPSAPLASARLPLLVPGQTALPGDLVVGVAPGSSERAVAALLAPLGQTAGYSAHLHTVRVRLHAGITDALALTWLREQAGVAFAENNHRVQITAAPNDVSYSAQWALPKIQADQAWGKWVPQGQIVLAIVDTGVDINHPDLGNVLLKDTAGNVIGHDATGAGSFLDGLGHGTHCAGIAAAQINNGTSYTDPSGKTAYGIAGTVGWNGESGKSDTSHIKIMPVRVLDSSGSGSDVEVADGIEWATDHGAQVISLSLGGPEDPNNPGPPALLNAAVQYAWNKGVLVVAAAGNSNTNVRFYPAACPNVVSVAASDSNDTLASFSNYGDWVTVAAPGVSILSTLPTYDTGSGWGTNYGYLSGTSMATPHVAGEAALLLAQKVGLTNQQVYDLLLSSVDAINGSKTIHAGAGGRVNFLTALQSITSSVPIGVTGLYNTGLDTANHALSDSSVDTHYTLVSTPSGGGGTAFVTQQHFPIQSGVWLLDTPTSKWVSPSADEQQGNGPGNYTYQTTFSLTAAPNTIKITGQVAADDTVSAIILNGVTVATNVSNTFSAWSPFTLTTGLQSGTNTLQFVVRNGGTSISPSGFRCEMSAGSTSSAAPVVPAAPANLFATSGNAKVTLNWTAVPNATTYNIKRGASLSGPFTPIATLQSATTFTDGGTNSDGSSKLTNGTLYYYVVTAMNAAGESGNSNTAGATPSSAPPSSGTVTFVKADTSTSGSWKGIYGSKGYNVLANAVSYPPYATVSGSGQLAYTWAASTSDTRALQQVAGTSRIAACWYTPASPAVFTLDVNLTDGNVHQVSFYCLDWDRKGRAQKVEMLDATTNAVLDTRNLSGFTSGAYLVYTLTGHVKVRVTCTGGLNAVLSGLFFD